MLTTNSRSSGLSAVVSMSRTTGASPLLAFVDAVATTDPSTVRPFQDLDYEWDSGYASTAWSTNSRSSRLSYGGAACFFYDIPEGGGNVTVNPTLTVRNSTGVTVVALPSITITDPALAYTTTNTICFSNDTDMVGAPAGADVTGINISALSTVMAALAAGKRVLMRAGDTFTSAGQITKTITGGAGWTLGSFGAGAKPICSLTANDSRLFRFDGVATDGRVMDLALTGPGATSAGPSIGSGAATSRLSLIRCDTTAFASGHIWDEGGVIGTYTQIGVISCTASALIGGSGFYGLWISGQTAVMGCTIDKDGGTNEHCLRTQYLDRGVITNNILTSPGTGKHCIALRAPIFSVASVQTRYIVINHNAMLDGQAGLLQMGAQNVSNDERVRDVTVDGNIFTNGASTESIRINNSEVTIRNNIMIGTGPAGSANAMNIVKLTASPVCDNIRIRHNSYYNADAAGAGLIRVLRITDATTTNVYFQNNVGWAPNATSPDVILDGSTQTAFVTPGRNSTDAEFLGTCGFADTTPADPAAGEFNPANYATTAGAFVDVHRDYNAALRVTYLGTGAVKP